MKKLLLLLTCVAGLLYPASYSQLRSEFKEKFSGTYVAYFGLIKRDNYRILAEKYLLEAEQGSLILSNIPKTTPLNDHQAGLLERYFYITKNIHYKICTNLIHRDTPWDLDFDKSLLLKQLYDLKEAFDLNINPETEIENTINLIHKINQDFVKQIGPRGCTKIRRAEHWEQFKISVEQAMMVPAFTLMYPIYYFLVRPCLRHNPAHVDP